MIDYWNCDSSATLDKRLRDLTSITLSFEQNKIVNHVRAFHTSSTIAACCNDKAIALIDPDSSTILRRHTFPYAINVDIVVMILLSIVFHDMFFWLGHRCLF